jgi:tetrahydromethanopterin S-methyltransferase subunit G
MEQVETPESKVTTRAAGIRYGVIAGLISIAYFMVMTIADMDMTEGIGRWASLLITGVIIYLAHKYYKENGDGFMTIGQGTGIGFWLALVSSTISSVFTYIYIKFIDNSMIQQMLDKQREGMEERGMDDEQIDQAMTMTEKFMTPEIIFGTGIVFGIIIVVIVALLISLVTQKKNPEEAF